MTSKEKQYWAYARECEFWASSVKDERDRAIFFEMQTAWVELALQRHHAVRGVRHGISDVRGHGDRHNQMEQSRASPPRNGMIALRLVAIFLAGITAGTLLTTPESRGIAHSAFAEAKTTMNFFLSAPANATR